MCLKEAVALVLLPLQNEAITLHLLFSTDSGSPSGVGHTSISGPLLRTFPTLGLQTAALIKVLEVRGCTRLQKEQIRMLRIYPEGNGHEKNSLNVFAMDFRFSADFDQSRIGSTSRFPDRLPNSGESASCC